MQWTNNGQEFELDPARFGAREYKDDLHKPKMSMLEDN